MNQTIKNEHTIDLRELFFSLIAQWKLILLCILVSLVFVLLYLRVTPDTYSVNALIQVEPKKGASSALLGQELSGLIEGSGGNQLAQAEMEIIKSRLVMGQTVKKLNLDISIRETDDSFFKKLTSKNNFRTQYSADGVRVQNNTDSFFIKDFKTPLKYLNKSFTLKVSNDEFRLYEIDSERVLLKGNLNKNNIITTPDGTWNVNIYSSGDLKNTYFISQLALQTAIAIVQGNLATIERAKQTGLISLSYEGQDKSQITDVLNVILQTYKQQNIERNSAEKEQTLSFLDKQLPELRKQLDQSERQYNVFRQKYNTVDIGKESELYLSQSMALESQKIELQQKQAELSAKYTAEHPAMQEVNSQLNNINSKIAELDGTLKKLPDIQRQSLQLYRDVEVKNQLYTSLLNTYQTLNVAKAGEIGNVRIIDMAVEPLGPIKPRRSQILLLSILLGAFIGTLLAIFRLLLRTGIKDSTQIENEFDLPVYATVPRSSLQESRIKLLKKKKSIPILAIKHGDDVAIESLRSMRTAIHFALANAKNNIISIAGPEPEVGKSFISVNLATILAQSNKRVLLIDADLRRGYLNKYFNAEIKPGLSEYLAGEVGLNEITHHSEVAGLDMITCGKSPANPSEALSTPQFIAFLEQIMPLYDHILIDTPPVLAVTDGVVIAQNAGVNLVIARHAKTHMKELELTLSRFEQAGIKVNGFILNDIQSTAGYSYGYNYAYGYKTNKDD
ncbi:polysaccharide biosynthesis tyrosine autokinase [Acinetobacter soli]|uniref:polysaccharide biosynthesis tyrosine autokinase n=1 Tax=Acinetobacter soli TaxID=487316 RepID=UPI002D7E1511|nr:polysaccharide biosynthesis tyrosine autokinase [Acinetobacter soli]MEB4800921.1 polysaccharide biosynthesis tyrosine autokinase [Acinetobacter soli]